MQDEMFRLASLGIGAVDNKLGNALGTDLRKFMLTEGGIWDNFFHRESLKILVRYSLIQRVEGDWPGVTMHSLVQWRAKHSNQNQPWEWWCTNFVLAACSKITKDKPEFRRHLVVHLPSFRDIDLVRINNIEMGEIFLWNTLAYVHYYEGQWEEAEKLQVQVVDAHKTKLGEDHLATLTSMANLAMTYWNQGRWEEAEKLNVQVVETDKTKLGENHPHTLITMANLALIYRDQGRWEEAEKLNVQV
ncbi:uncharacterized protein ASPGLDRAFT_30469 [Aspergillus glaucus CBS 516.65]|uniref:MalT-like TPR region domain-containing protein n=1 Tax=Aspergillus glaucus CBS 516.65 TaxID=1160497 RepID=A0A1L9V458_ASPGL|nr:hypothetical protein ASPGLDRAFT_30469 [Aspergillus glaucus CBS 516.65]OJJ78724.1 hypothetical protein ASPGLDRAFT_30469 [Aspergillus glaucus CBS 516.65]